jgi:Domain of unknown function (DUF5615)
VILALREAGHDVLAIAEFAKGVSDDQVMERAIRERRVVITEDRDFGELVYARGSNSAGIIFVKFHSRARRGKPMAVVEAVAKLGRAAILSPATCLRSLPICRRQRACASRCVRRASCIGRNGRGRCARDAKGARASRRS